MDFFMPQKFSLLNAVALFPQQGRKKMDFFGKFLQGFFSKLMQNTSQGIFKPPSGLSSQYLQKYLEIPYYTKHSFRSYSKNSLEEPLKIPEEAPQRFLQGYVQAFFRDFLLRNLSRVSQKILEKKIVVGFSPDSFGDISKDLSENP